QELRLGLHVELLGHLKQLGKQSCNRDFLERPAKDWLPDRAAGLGKGVDGPGRRDIAGSEVDFSHSPVIANQKADQHIGEIPPGGAVEPPHDAEIDDYDRPRGIDKHIPGMQIGVKKTVAEYLVEKGPGRLCEHIIDPMPGGNQPGSVVDAYSLD